MKKKGRQKFTDIWANQTNLGKQFGLSPIAMGKKLKELKLRGEDGNPTAQALCQGYCTPTPLKDGTPFFMWNRQQVEELMQAHGYRRLDPHEAKARELAESWVQVHEQWQGGYLRCRRGTPHGGGTGHRERSQAQGFDRAGQCAAARAQIRW